MKRKPIHLLLWAILAIVVLLELLAHLSRVTLFGLVVTIGVIIAAVMWGRLYILSIPDKR